MIACAVAIALRPCSEFLHRLEVREYHAELRREAAHLRLLRRRREEHIRRARGVHAVHLARRFLGVPYVWGGSSPAGFDCSGLVQYVYRHIGVHLPRTTWLQREIGRAVSLGSLRRGDLVFANGGEHVGLYAGSGLVVEAPHTGAYVRLAPLSWFGAEFARRPL